MKIDYPSNLVLEVSFSITTRILDMQDKKDYHKREKELSDFASVLANNYPHVYQVGFSVNGTHGESCELNVTIPVTNTGSVKDILEWLIDLPDGFIGKLLEVEVRN